MLNHNIWISLSQRNFHSVWKNIRIWYQDVVAEIPYDIDGTRWYIIDVPEEDAFFAKYRDGRFFQIHTSRRKGFNGVRRLGKCRSNFACDNTSCPYFTENG